MSQTRSSHKSECLITFVGFGDPYLAYPPEKDTKPGPIVALTNLRNFHRILLLATPDTVLHAERTQAELQRLQKNVETEIIHLPITDPTDYASLLGYLRDHVKPLMQNGQGEEFFVATASGTAQMHACWILLVASGELPARILQTRRARFVRDNFPIIRELDLKDAIFPGATGELDTPQLKLQKPHTNAVQAAREAGIIGDHPDLLRAVEVATTLAPYDTPLLLQGETGTGKDLLAQLIHRTSGRPEHLFVRINCAAIPPQLADSILFGHRKGAFNGATRDHAGKFLQAEGGTLFLDEISELPLSIQAKLLRFFEHGVIEPLGSYDGVTVNVRIIAATSSSLQRAIQNREFRRDLYYRFGEVIHLPPLRERRSDIPIIAMAILDRLNQTFTEPRRFAQNTLEKLRRAYWHGNVRDLQNVIERAAILCNEPVIQPEHVILQDDSNNPDLLTVPEPFEGFSMEKHLSAVRKLLIHRAIKLANDNKSQAARLLGVTPQAVHKFLKQSDPPNKKR